MKPRTVSTRLRHLYAFLRFFEDREVVHPDLLKRKLRVKVPEGLPRAMDPEDVRHLLSLIDKPRDSGHDPGIAADRDAHRGVVGHPGE